MQELSLKVDPFIFFCSPYSHEGMSTGAGDGGAGSVGGVQNSGGGRNTPPHGSPTPMDKATLKVHLPNGKLFYHLIKEFVALSEKIEEPIDETYLLLIRTNKISIKVIILKTAM